MKMGVELMTQQRRGAVAVLTALSLIVIFAFTALTIDLGRLQMAKNELQRAADGAALAGAQDLVLPIGAGPDAAAIASADFVARLNPVLTVAEGLDCEADVEFGESLFDGITGKASFSPVNDVFKANVVRVTLRRTEGSKAGPIEYMFAPVFGQKQGGVLARASAMVVPRDIAVVIDLSGSMNDDSELRHAWDYTGFDGATRNAVEINLRDVWAALDGPSPNYPYLTGDYNADTGPTIGAMTQWGKLITPGSYDPTTDSGLWQLALGANFTDPAANSSLAMLGYSPAEISTLTSATSDSAEWKNRAAVMLGLATWSPSGAGDTTVGSGELTWAPYPSFRKDWTWGDYIDYVARDNSSMVKVNADLQYRFGLKTFVNFLLDSKAKFSQTELFFTPEQPIQAVKDAVQTMVFSTGAVDAMSLEVFAQTARHEIDLTSDKQLVANRLYAMQAAHYDSVTNIGGGIDKAINELTSTRSRKNARKVIVFMSDGVPNVDETGNYVGNSSGGAAWSYALAEAQRAADEGIRIYTVSVGDNLDRALMQEIASIGNGQEFHAAGSPDEYSQELRDIFRTIGGKRETVLIE